MAKKIIFYLGILVVGVTLIIGAMMWFLWRNNRVNSGQARATFPYADYTQEELNKMYPQTLNENVATTRTPEETHQLFLNNLKAGKLDEAVECCFRRGDWEEMKNGLNKINEKGELTGMIKDLDTDIKPGLVYESIASYSYDILKDGKTWGSSIDFVKNNQGVWLIKSL